MSDPAVAKSLGNTVFYTALHVPLAMAVSLGLALLLQRVGRAAGLFRTIFYLPVMTPAVAVGILFLFLLNGQRGLIKGMLALVGIEGPNWTTDPAWIKPGIVLMSLWTQYHHHLPGRAQQRAQGAVRGGPDRRGQLLAPVPPHHRADDSGALFFTLIVNTIASLQLFAEVYTMYFGNRTTQGSTTDAALFYVVYLFQQAFQFLHMGFASAMAWLLFLVILAITVLQVKFGNRFVYYEGD